MRPLHQRPHIARASRAGRAVVVAGLLVASRSAAEPTAADVEVVVKGDAAHATVPPKDPSVAGSVVRGESLRSPGLRATEVLRSQPGVQVVELGGAGAPATAAIRGATAADTPVYLGGVRLNDDVGGTADLSLVPLWLIDRVEIYRGNAPIEADRLGPGGAIFFEPRVPTRTTAGAGGMLGSFGARSGWAYAGLRSGAVSSLVGVNAAAADNDYRFVNDHGTQLERTRDTVDTRSNADTATVDAWGLGRVDFERGGRVDVLVNGITREQGVPTLALLPSHSARSKTERALTSVVSTVPFGSREQHKLEARTSTIFSRTVFTDPKGEIQLRAPELEVTARRVEQSLATTLEVSPSWTLRPAATVAYERIHRSPDDIPLGRSHRFFARAATAVEFRASEHLVFRGLGATECHAMNDDDSRACDVLEPSGRIGLEVAGSDTTLLANFGRYVRVPTLGEIFGVSGVVRGNPDLVPERGLTAELGLRAHSKAYGALRGAYADVFLFVRAADQLIAYQRTNQGYVIPYNVDGARVLGAEILTGVALLSSLHAEIAATLQDPRDTSAGRTTVNDLLPYRSRLILSPRISMAHTFEASSWLRRIGGSAAYTYQASRYVDPAGLGVIDEQGSLDLTTEASWLEGHLTTRARLANLFNTDRRDVIGYPLPGRSVYFSLEATW